MLGVCDFHSGDCREAPMRRWHLNQDLQEGVEGTSHGDNGVNISDRGNQVQSF